MTNTTQKKEKKNGKYNLLPLQVPVALDYKRYCHIHCKILQLHKITWHFFTASAKTKTRFELNFLFTLYGCLWISVKMSETRTATKTAAEQKQKQQRCSHNKNRLTQSLRRERERNRKREKVSAISSEPLVLSMYRRFCNQWTLQKYPSKLSAQQEQNLSLCLWNLPSCCWSFPLPVLLVLLLGFSRD